MRISIYQKCKSFPHGAVRLAFTGGELLKLIGTAVPDRGFMRAAINLHPNGKMATITFNKETGLLLRPIHGVTAKNGHVNLNPVMTVEVITPVMSILNLAPQKHSVSQEITGTIQGNQLTFVVPHFMTSNTRSRPAVHHMAVNHSLNGAGDSDMTGGSLMDTIRTSLNMLNQSLAQARQEGWEVNVAVNEDSVVKAKIAPKAFDL